MIRLYSDTSANLPLTIVKKFNIKIVPFSYTVDSVPVDYDSETEFDGKAFYDLMRNGTIKTSMVSFEAFTRLFEEALKNGDDVLYIGMSGGISGTAQSAAMAASELAERYPERRIAVIDSFAASLGEGMLVMRAAVLIEQGKTLSRVKREVLKHRDTMSQFFTVDNLEYLKRGGRISGTAALAGKLLNIKPLLRGDETGRIVMCGKARGKRNALTELAKKYAELAVDKNSNIGIAHCDCEEDAKQLLGMLKKEGFKGECLTVCYEPVTGSHVGPGTVALFFDGAHK